MNITLRKANAIQNAITDAIRNIHINYTITINEFQDPVEQLKAANDRLFANDERRQKLLLALYNIRGLVGTANAQSGIDLCLTKAAFIDRRIQQLEEMVELNPHTDLAVLEGRLNKIRNRTEDRMYQETTVNTSVVNQEQIDSADAEIKNLKRQKQKINDEVLELNIKTEIPLSEEVVETLTREGII